ncbi:MAG: class I SAM-dependent RNA methyltransferase [Crocinitomix sp.]|nr:class I SAM-dependent RNA methyltransferase [Crocinitomix sp.]
MEIVAKTLYGLEEVLKDEIVALGGQDVKVGNRVVTYKGDMKLLYESNLWLRTAISILIPLKKFRFADEKDLYRKFTRIDFSEIMGVKDTFAAKGAVNSDLFNHTGYPMLVLKDAIADHFRDKFGERPDVDLTKPKILFDVHIDGHACSVSLNSSGAPLYHRGYRKKTGDAPMNEVVAAGLIKLAKWNGESNFVDVTCGSGTLPIEAALIANGIPPNIARKSYGFQNWKNYDQQLWKSVFESAPNHPKRDLDIKIIGSDTDGDVILKARDNIKALPLGKTISFEIKDYNDQEAPEGKGVLICNPPYGERLQMEDLDELYQGLGNFFKRKMQGYDCWVLSSNFDALKKIELKPSAKLQIYNGSLSCDFRKFEIFSGSLIEHKYGDRNQKREPKRNKKK